MNPERYGRSRQDLADGGTISARGMALQKRLFPLVSIIGLLVAAALVRQRWPENLALLAAVIIIDVAGSILIGMGLFKQADEVIDAGDHLIVTKNDQEIRIPLRDVTKVRATFWGVTLHLSQEGPFGSTITFTPQRTLGRGAVVMSLRTRTEAARRLSQSSRAAHS